MKVFLFLSTLLIPVAGAVQSASAQVPVQATVWKHADGSMGSSPDERVDAAVSTILADVDLVAYDNDYTYIHTSGVPSHSVGGFAANPGVPGDLDMTYRISHTPTPAAVNEATSIGTIGIGVNGVAIYNWSHGGYWNPDTNTLDMARGGGTNDWNVNALWAVAPGLDYSGGHPGPGMNGGTYHYHRNPTGLLDQIDPGNTGTSHSALFGFAFDSYPIYGTYGFNNGLDDTDGISAMTSSYQLVSSRPDGGPSEEDFALGSFIEDFEYIEGSGTLNEFNMAFTVTPEYPEGTWAYFSTFDGLTGGTSLDENNSYPFMVGPNYFGEVDALMVTPGSTFSLPGNTTTYFEFQAVPEPSSALLLGLVAIGLSTRRRR